MPKREDPNYRWEHGIPHHPKSVELMKHIIRVDDKWCEGAHQWEIGGDGDIGEDLMYAMDSFFEAEEKAHANR